MASNRSGYACINTNTRFQSRASSYGDLTDTFSHDAESDVEEEDVEFRCPLTLETAKDTMNYFSWIFIPTGVNTQVKPYKVEALSNLFSSSRNGVVKDPYKNFTNLLFMQSRLNLYMSASKEQQELLMSDVTDEFRTGVLQAYMDYWRTGESKPLECSQIFCNLNTFVAKKLVHNIDHTQSMTLLKHAENGTYLIRESSKSAKDQRGDASVFSISFKSQDGAETSSIRFLNLHKVGVYVLTIPDTYKNISAVYGLNNSLAIRTLKIKDILTVLNNDFNSLSPPYPTIIHMLQDLHAHGVISIDRFLTYE